ncbi:box C/D snoRNA protein 1-like [Abrus precatorius]|uniref:Box C/D snoRNA protein 1-like n=1 Tax=Abrus precatorius TaxID=3816 RepID=A0A8B8K4D3_ABRPR|nr:box C/D snoRNA protein 1-like [Abrus precatorius]XP_027338516.1 box C/D snoRNA protein 1-like [Abrus precatorius]
MSASLSQTEEQVSIPRGPTLCEECKCNPWKYKCPGCSLHSCSLPCVKSHKVRTGCAGKRNQTQFIPLSQFDDNLLLSDYNLLEEVKRVAESAQRMRDKLGMYAYFKLPHQLKSLRSAAGSRRTKVLFLPNGMSKREKNQSRYDQRQKFISWTIEWRFHSTDIVLHDHGVSENTGFYSILQKHLKPGPWNHQLRQFCEDHLDSLKLFIRKYPKGPRSPFKELDMKAPIRQQLANIVILEFPVIFVFLPSHKINFEVIKDVNTNVHKSLQKDSEGNQSPKGVSFREVTIEDDDSVDSKVFDLMKPVESSSSHQVLTQNTSSKKAPNDSSDISLFEGDTGNLSHSLTEIKELEFSENMAFDFDQDFMDIYGGLLDQTNPSDFFYFDSVFAKKTENDIELLGSDGVFPLPAELEEGEIPE